LSFLLVSLVVSLSAGSALARADDKVMVASVSGSLEGAAFKAACADGVFSVTCSGDASAATAADSTTDKPKRHALMADSATPVPEPSTLMLMAAGVAAIGFVGR